MEFLDVFPNGRHHLMLQSPLPDHFGGNDSQIQDIAFERYCPDYQPIERQRPQHPNPLIAQEIELVLNQFERKLACLAGMRQGTKRTRDWEI